MLPRRPEPCLMVIFGASGDLTYRKLIPALYDLVAARLLPSGFAILGFARKPKTSETFRQEMRRAVEEFARSRPIPIDTWEDFARRLHYMTGDYNNPADYRRLQQELEALSPAGRSNWMFYLATPPEVYRPIVEHIGSEVTLQRQGGWTRIIVEKPFGHDLDSARALNQHLHRWFREDQIYRIDHYLGKETVQNILVFRFANGIFEPIWDRRYVDHVQITVAETLGIGNRGSYYERAGVIRDIMQNHMLQLVSLVAMEPPAEFTADAVRNEKVKVLKALRVDTSRGDGTVRGQYGPGVINGQFVPGYTQEQDVAPDSTTETYLAMRLMIDNWRWAGVPFYVRSGKRLPRRVTEIAIQFKMPPLLLFSERTANEIQPNLLVLNIQPDEGISLRFSAKVPGSGENIQPVIMNFSYNALQTPVPDAYERLLLDAMLGDSTLFTRHDEVEASWSVIMPVIERWQSGQGSFLEMYRAGTWGPKEADDFIAADGRSWRVL
ncbi:MAG: glucose-6-phosphate dehydrogenase [Anaerolineales bacterium]|nr:glucose-6-phosphate dehydrogenase [Anaerolineales bacterium]MCX7609717.1 glucose-6-phosphate dehydrogenase [Anaerolineales bacterium]MDW8226747.1 glucose-6-phosphate dehydrogenase [Anaerolineales bacterium]